MKVVSNYLKLAVCVLALALERINGLPLEGLHDNTGIEYSNTSQNKRHVLQKRQKLPKELGDKKNHNFQNNENVQKRDDSYKEATVSPTQRPRPSVTKTKYSSLFKPITITHFSISKAANASPHTSKHRRRRNRFPQPKKTSSMGADANSSVTTSQQPSAIPDGGDLQAGLPDYSSSRTYEPTDAPTEIPVTEAAENLTSSTTDNQQSPISPEPEASAPEGSTDTSPIAPIPSPSEPYLSANVNPTPPVGPIPGGITLSCDLFNKAVVGAGYPAPSQAQCDSFLKGLNVGNISSNTEAAMFLASIIWESDGLRAKEEYYCKENDCSVAYGSPEDAPGKVYSGRGYIQLTWAANYIAASNALFGDRRLLENPEQVSTDEQTAWDVSFWYWKDRVRTDPRVLNGQFGAATDMINGALECRGGYADKAKKRFEIYKVVLELFSPGTTPIETGCYN